MCEPACACLDWSAGEVFKEAELKACSSTQLWSIIARWSFHCTVLVEP